MLKICHLFSLFRDTRHLIEGHSANLKKSTFITSVTDPQSCFLPNKSFCSRSNQVANVFVVLTLITFLPVFFHWDDQYEKEKYLEGLVTLLLEISRQVPPITVFFPRLRRSFSFSCPVFDHSSFGIHSTTACKVVPGNKGKWRPRCHQQQVLVGSKWKWKGCAG